MSNSEYTTQSGPFEARDLAFLRTVAQPRSAFHRYCARMTGSMMGGEGVAQLTLFEAYRKLDQFDDARQLKPWLVSDRAQSVHRFRPKPTQQETRHRRVPRAVLRGTRCVLRRECCELALECLAYSGAPALGDGLGRGIGKDFLFTFLQSVEDAGSCGFGRDFRYVEAAVHISIDGADDYGMNRDALAGQKRSQ